MVVEFQSRLESKKMSSDQNPGYLLYMRVTSYPVIFKGFFVRKAMKFISGSRNIFNHSEKKPMGLLMEEIRNNHLGCIKALEILG